jgi:hypothetical protein
VLALAVTNRQTTVTASYGGDAGHDPSQGTTTARL